MTAVATLSTGVFAQPIYVNIMDQNLLAGAGNYRSVNNLFSIDSKELAITELLDCAFIDVKNKKVLYDFELAYNGKAFMLNSSIYHGKLQMQSETYGTGVKNMYLKNELIKSDSRSQSIIVGSKDFIQGNIPDDGQSWGEKLDFSKATKLEAGATDFKLKSFGKTLDVSIQCIK
jgi:hypothetical protein